MIVCLFNSNPNESVLKSESCKGFSLFIDIDIESLERINGAKFVLADETRNVKGGFILQVEKVYINNTVEALVAENKDAMNSEVAAMLFE